MGMKNNLVQDCTRVISIGPSTYLAEIGHRHGHEVQTGVQNTDDGRRYKHFLGVKYGIWRHCDVHRERQERNLETTCFVYTECHMNEAYEL